MVEATQPLAWHDLQCVLRRSPALLLAACKHFGSDVMIAGGFIRACIAREDVNDIDVFACSKQRSIEMIHWILKAVHGVEDITKHWKESVHETDNAYTLKHWQTPIQFVHRWTFTDPVSAIQSFDFTISRAAFWFEKVYRGSFPDAAGNEVKVLDNERSGWRSVADIRFYADLASKRLIYTNPIRNEDAGGSMLRVLKYYQRGYRIPIDSLGAVMARLMMGVRYKAIEENDEKRWHVPVEVKLGEDITRLLREVDPDIDPRHVAHLPSEKENHTA